MASGHKEATASISSGIVGRLGRGELLVFLLGSLASGVLIVSLDAQAIPGVFGWLSLNLVALGVLAASTAILFGKWIAIYFLLLALTASGALWAAVSHPQLFPVASLPKLESQTHWLAVITTILAGWTAFQFARLHRIWQRLRQALESRSNESDAHQDRIERGFSELFAYLLLSLTALTAIAYGLVWSETAAEASGPTIPVFVSAMLVAFAPLIFGFFQKERWRSETERKPLLIDDVISPLWFYVSVAAIAFVTFIAVWAAGRTDTGIGDPIAFGTFGVVLGGFLAVIITPHILRFWRGQTEKSTAVLEEQRVKYSGIAAVDFPARVASWIDSLLVKLVAPLTGATQRRFAHVNVFLILSLLSALGFIVPSPFGLIPISVGIIFAIALGRRWAWVEGDRETASRLETTQSDNIRLGFENDLKDEALLGYAGLFVLVPLTLYQLQDLTGFVQEDGGLLAWVAFFGGELAKAVPFVDWWDIYGGLETDGRSELSATGKHLTFLSRAMVDLVILAALFQALGIWQRGRVQNKLYREGHLESFDPFKELEFFDNGMTRLPINTVEGQYPTERLYREQGDHGDIGGLFLASRKFAQVVEQHFNNKKLLISSYGQSRATPTPYSSRRLGELIQSSNSDVRAAANWMIKRYDVLVGPPLTQVVQINQKWVKQSYRNILASTELDHKAERRIEKLEFERILLELTELGESEMVTEQQFQAVLDCATWLGQGKDTDYTMSIVVDFISRRSEPTATYWLAKLILDQSHLEERPDWPNAFLEQIDAPDPAYFRTRVEARQMTYRGLAHIAMNLAVTIDARRTAVELLEWMASQYGDRADSGKTFAADRLREVPTLP